MTRRLSCMKQSFGFKDSPGTAHDTLCWLDQFRLDRAKNDFAEIVVSPLQEKSWGSPQSQGITPALER